MIKAEFEMDMPRECHECPFQLKFKGEDVDNWYSRRCVLVNQRIEYPRPDWCPLQKEQKPKTGHWVEHRGLNDDKYYDCSICDCSLREIHKGMEYCPYCGAKMDNPL